MSTRTVRLDDEAEKALVEIRRATGMTISVALKQGLLALRHRLAEQKKANAWTVYERIDIGPGGYAVGTAGNAKRAVREVIRRKHRR